MLLKGHVPRLGAPPDVIHRTPDDAGLPMTLTVPTACSASLLLVVLVDSIIGSEAIPPSAAALVFLGGVCSQASKGSLYLIQVLDCRMK